MADLSKFQDNVKLRDLRERVRDTDEAELRDLLGDLERDILQLRSQAMVQGLPNPMRIRQDRKLIARIQTELAARENRAAKAGVS